MQQGYHHLSNSPMNSAGYPSSTMQQMGSSPSYQPSPMHISNQPYQPAPRPHMTQVNNNPSGYSQSSVGPHNMQPIANANQYEQQALNASYHPGSSMTSPSGQYSSPYRQDQFMSGGQPQTGQGIYESGAQSGGLNMPPQYQQMIPQSRQQPQYPAYNMTPPATPGTPNQSLLPGYTTPSAQHLTPLISICNEISEEDFAGGAVKAEAAKNKDYERESSGASDTEGASPFKTSRGRPRGTSSSKKASSKFISFLYNRMQNTRCLCKIFRPRCEIVIHFIYCPFRIGRGHHYQNQQSGGG